MKKEMNITVVGLGYVGLPLALLLKNSANVIGFDVDVSKIQSLTDGKMPYKDIGAFDISLKDNSGISFTSYPNIAFDSPDYVIIAVPTNFDDRVGGFDTSNIRKALDQIKQSESKPVVVIKSTVPVGFTNAISKEYPELVILFSPEFLRETKCIEDTLYPSRIVVGHERHEKEAKEFADILFGLSLDKDVDVLLTGLSEAESIKLFSNTYLAMRVAFFNELDTFAVSNGLKTKDIVKGVCLDKRIGDFYNNPSFGYGGYCLPKDTKQLKTSFKDIPGTLINGIVSSNEERKAFIASLVENKIKQLGIEKSDAVIGVYRLSMKVGSMNHRSSSIVDVAAILIEKGYKVMAFEPSIPSSSFEGMEIVNEEKLLADSTIILSNRMDDALLAYREKVITADLFGRD